MNPSFNLDWSPRMTAHCVRSLIFTSLMASPALAVDYHVNPSGAYPTIQSAIVVAAVGDRVLVEDVGAPTSYYEDINFLGKDIVVQTDPANLFEVSIVGTGTLPVVTLASGEPITSLLKGFRITGGASAYGGGILVQNSSATLMELLVERNTGDYGAGIALIRSRVNLYQVHLFANNEPALGFYGIEGGGLFIDGSDVNWKGGSARDNRALSGGGLHVKRSRMRVANVLFLNNSSDYGGGAYLAKSKLAYVFHDCAFIANSAMIIGGTGPSVGGGVLAAGSMAEFYRCSLESNYSFDGPGGGLAGKGAELTMEDCYITESFAHHGGGVYLRSAILKANRTSITGNRANTNGGGLQVEGSGSAFTAMQCKILYNEAQRGGGIALEDYADMYVDQSEINENSALIGGGIFAFGKYGTRVLSASYVYGNTAGVHGGGLFVVYKASFTITGQTFFEQNSAANEGGGIFAARATLLFDASRCCYNTAGGLGGGLRSVMCAPVVQNSIISNNFATDVDGTIVNIASSIGGGC